MSARIRIEHDGHLAFAILCRKERRNALDDAMIAELGAALSGAAQAGPAALVLTGEGESAFSAGYDLACIEPGQPVDDPLPDDRFAPAVQAVLDFPAPVIAVLNGDAFGGGLDLALAADFRLAHPAVRVGMTPVRLGLVYNARGLARFIGRLGPQTARRLFLLGEPMDAATALRLGIIDEVVPIGGLLRRARELAASVAQGAPLAVAGTRRAIRLLESGTSPSAEDLREIERQRRAAFSSPELALRLAAFRDRPKNG